MGEHFGAIQYRRGARSQKEKLLMEAARSVVSAVGVQWGHCHPLVHRDCPLLLLGLTFRLAKWIGGCDVTELRTGEWG